MRINTNVAALNAYRNLSRTSERLGRSLERLSSGLRINRAADDAAGLVRSELLRAEIRGTNQAIDNAQDAISLVQTAEGALNEAHAILQRIRELAVSAANETSSGAAEQAEIDQLVAELQAIGTRSGFAGLRPFAGDAATRELTFQIGAQAGDQLVVRVGTLVDADGAWRADGVFGDALVGGTAFAASGFAGIRVAKEDGGEPGDVITVLDRAIAAVSSERANLGASHNRLRHTIENLRVASENLTASESRIRDTDMAREMVEFTRNQILQQAGVAMLAQANALPRSVLALLQ